METIEKSIEVDVPVSTAYNQWTQFEDFPQFMEGVEEIRQLDDKRLHWKAEIGGKVKEWDAEIFEQTPDQRIAWRSTTGTKTSGLVAFRPLGDGRTRVTLTLNYETDGVMESVADFFGVISRRVEGDLKRFKEFIEARRTPTGAWRGEIHGREVEPDPLKRGAPAAGMTAAEEPRSKRIHSTEPPKM